MSSKDENKFIEENIKEAKGVKWEKVRLILDKSRDHEHCIICWTALNSKITSEAYESSPGWICDECYKKYIKNA